MLESRVAAAGLKEGAEGLKEKLGALGFRPELAWPFVLSAAGLAGSALAMSSQESLMLLMPYGSAA